MKTINRNETRELLNDPNVTAIETLPRASFEEYHLPTAKNVPVDEQFEDNIQQAAQDKTKPVVVYCKDSDCNASAMAAQKMGEMGYERVFDYEAGKEDWKEAGLPVES